VAVCPYDGPTPPAAVAAVAARLLALGAGEVSLGDTIGAGTPESIGAMLAAVIPEAGADQLAGHFHDTGGRALANMETALEAGLRVFDTSVAGLGGCPFAPGAPGNLDTRAAAERLAALGFETGINLDRLAGAEAIARRLRGG
jgi:hydroxymethylglutaryl-CoA lyase